MTIIEGKNICKTYNGVNESGAVNALKGVDIKIEQGDFIGIMGTSGSGKTTLMNVLSGIDNLDSGTVNFLGKNIDKVSVEERSLNRRDNMGIIFQDFNLLENLNMKENIMLPLVMDKVDEVIAKQKAEEIMKMLNIEKLGDKYQDMVSGGEKQRTAIGRAIIKSPKIIFADEPTGNLDSKSAENVMRHLVNINKNEKISILLVTHDPSIASYCDKIIFLKDGEINLKIEKKGNRMEFMEYIKNCQQY